MILLEDSLTDICLKLLFWRKLKIIKKKKTKTDYLSSSKNTKCSMIKYQKSIHPKLIVYPGTDANNISHPPRYSSLSVSKDSKDRTRRRR